MVLQSPTRCEAPWLSGSALASGAKGPRIEICTVPKKIHATHVFHLGNELYSHLLHSTPGTGLTWEVNRFIVDQISWSVGTQFPRKKCHIEWQGFGKKMYNSNYNQFLNDITLLSNFLCQVYIHP